MAILEAGMSSDVAQASRDEYQVFLSFRGPDTRNGFTDFLYHNLINFGVRVFRDDEELRVGDVIGENLLHAINNSVIYIPIFSRTYASSRWCLRELDYIVDNVSKSEGKKSILPIFFDVQPEDVKLKTPQYKDALQEHQKQFPNEVKAWRAALVEAGKIKGWTANSSQARIVESVVRKVLEKLEIKQKLVTKHLVGLDQVKDLIELLDVDHRDVRLIGIYGMGGIGKTTIAKVVFNQLCSHFGKCCSFLEGVRERSSKEGIVKLQYKLLADIAGYAEKDKDSEQVMRRIGETLNNKKVFVVLDDVDKKEQFTKLIGNNSLYSGSRIIITTRSKTILQVEGFEGKILPYEMLKMDDGLALQLFCRHAFGLDFPRDVYHELSSEVVSHMGGLPLAIEVVGSLLKGKNEAFWKETLAKLKKEPEEEILKKLRISYDDLDKYQKQIFLDIACFFFNKTKTDAIYVWTDCQVYPERGIDVLTNRCLIKILDNDKFWMHDQLLALGRHIVREESQYDPRKQSRLWIVEEALQIIGTEERKDKVQALQIFHGHVSIEITNEDYERLPNLRFLELCGGTYAGDFARYRSKLRWFSWHFPLRDFRANNMYLDHLVVFKLFYGGFEENSRAWDLIKRAKNLKVLSLTGCQYINKMPDISKCLGLERLTLTYCDSLERIESYIGYLRSLIELKIENCWNFTNLPEEVGLLVKLKHFSLSGCRRLRKLPSSLGNLVSLTELELSDTIINGLSNSIENLKSLRILRLPTRPSVDWEDHDWQLPSGIGMLINLEELNLFRRDVTGEIPVGIGELSSLRILNLSHTRICGIPVTINMLHNLQTLNLRWCHEIQELPELPTNLTCLLLESESLLSIPNLSNLTNLVELLLRDCSFFRAKSNLITGCNLRGIGRLSRLKKLDLNLLNVPAPPELASLSNLEELALSRLDLKPLGLLPSSHWNWRNVSTLKFSWCEVEDIPLDRLPQLRNLAISYCKLLGRLSIPLELRNLRQVRMSYCPELVEVHVEHLLKSLESLKIWECESLTKIGGLSYLKNLERLEITRCNVLTYVEGLNELESLTSLIVWECPSLSRLIDASCTNIPDDCQVIIRACGDFVQDIILRSLFGIPLKSYKEEILLNRSNKIKHPFTVIFVLGVKKYSEGFGFVGGIEREKEDVAPGSITYEGLIANMIGFGFRLERMWYKAPGEDRVLLIEIKSDEQVNQMVPLASKRGFVHLYVEGGFDSEWDVSGPSEDSDSASEDVLGTEIQRETAAEVSGPGSCRYPGGWSICKLLCHCFCGLCYELEEAITGHNGFIDN